MKRKRKTKKEKKEIFIPNFTLILTVIFLLLGAIGMSQYKNTIKYCTAKATGIVTCRGFGRKDIGGNHNLSTGKKYAEILLYDDSKLAGKHIYAPVYVGDKGDTILMPLPITINKALFLCVLSAHSFSRHLYSWQYIIISTPSLRMTNAKENPRNNTKAG